MLLKTGGTQVTPVQDAEMVEESTDGSRVQSKIEDDHLGFSKCISCESYLCFKKSKQGHLFISCSSYPLCDVAMPFPRNTLNIEKKTVKCKQHKAFKFKLTFDKEALSSEVKKLLGRTNAFNGCIIEGCDDKFT
jgi:ssDNA-binding Zn-finger/Zn-ribbon topoisomerase 1